VLEPCEAKVSRTVLRGLGAGNRAWLLGQGGNRSSANALFLSQDVPMGTAKGHLG